MNDKQTLRERIVDGLRRGLESEGHKVTLEETDNITYVWADEYKRPLVVYLDRVEVPVEEYGNVFDGIGLGISMLMQKLREESE